MRRPRRWIASIGTVVLVAVSSGPPVRAAPPAPGDPPAPAKRRAFLIHFIHGGDPIVVDKYVEEGGYIRFEKYGGWVEIPRYEVVRIVPDQATESIEALPPAGDPATGDPATGADRPPLYVATRSGAGLRADAVAQTPSEIRVTTPEGSVTFPREDLVGVLRVPAPPAPPEAWITLWGAVDGRAPLREPVAGPEAPGAPPVALSHRPHLLQLASGVVIQVDGFWLEAGEIRFRRLGGVVGFALTEVARLLPQEVGPVRGRLPARFVRRLAPDRLEVRLPDGLRRVRLIGVEPLADPAVLEDPWSGLERGLPVHLEFDRERHGTDGDWLAYVYLPSGRMLNVELIRLGLARPRAETRNIRYLDLFQEVATLASGR